MKKHIEELKSQDLEKFKRDRIAEGVGAESIKYGLTLIRGTLKFAQQLGYQVSDITYPQIKLPKTLFATCLRMKSVACSWHSTLSAE